MKTKLISIIAATALSVAAFGQSDTLDFTINDWGLPEGSSAKQTEETTFFNETYSITIAAADGYYSSGSTTKYLMLGKAGSYLTLPSFSYAVERIDVVGTSGASTSVQQGFYVGEQAVSETTTGAKNVTNEYVIDAAYRTIGTRYTLKVLSAHNTQIAKIIIYPVGSAPQATLDSITVTNPKTEFYQDTKFAFGGIVTAFYDNGSKIDVTDDTQFSGYNMHTLGEQTVTASFIDSEREQSKVTTYTITVLKRPEFPEQATTYTSNITLNKNAGVKTNDAEVVIMNEVYTALKVGTSSEQGSITLTIPDTTTQLHFHMAGNKSITNASVLVSSNVKDTIALFDLVPDQGFYGSTKRLFLEGEPALEQYFCVDTEGATQITLTATKKSKCNFLLYGVNIYPAPPSSGFHSVYAPRKATKRLVNGQFVITVDGKEYSILGL